MGYTKYTWQNGEIITADKLNHMEDGIAATTGGAPLESTTYSELLTKRNNGTLTPGMQYRITDYVCTTTQEESRAVSHPFDIIVVADDESTLNENARACLHEGDSYYSAEGHQANLETWELKYCINNDTNRFAWADVENGKGVIYWMKDDRGNECPYDFKQIQFKRYKITECTVSSLIGKYTSREHGEAITATDTANPVWCYTFSVYDPEAEEIVFEDASIKLMDESTGCIVYGNSINSYYNYTDLGEETGSYIYYLNNIVFINTLGSYCNFNTFGDSCGFNTFGSNHFYNTFGNHCDSNTFGDGCSSNTFGDNCYSNTFGDGCYSNTFKDGCYSNTFEDDCAFNTFGDGCDSNTFGDDCNSNTFGIGCYSNTFGDGCYYNTFGDDCNSNTINTAHTRNYHILNNISNTQLVTTANNNHVTYIGKNSSGVLKTWVPADLVQ